MIRSRIEAAKFLQKFQQISSLIGSARPSWPSDADQEEIRRVTQTMARLLTDILVNVYYPLVEEHPQLRPVDLLGKAFADARYCVKSCVEATGEEHIVCTDLRPNEANEEMQRLQRDEGDDRFLWLELQDLPPESGLKMQDNDQDGG